jgi:hypothetical protein
MPFLTELQGKFERETENFTLTADLVYSYVDKITGISIIVAPKGFITNFANIPRFLRWYIDTDAPEIRDAAVIHDYNYSTNIHSRTLCDTILRNTMVELGASKTKAYLAYLGVRLCGSSNYRLK